MPNLHGDLPVEQRRKLFVMKRMREGFKGQMSYEDQIRIATNIGVRAVQEFDRNEYSHDWLKFLDTDQADATQVSLMLTVLEAGALAIHKWCDTKHEFPKSCDCAEIRDVLMARIPAVTPLEEPNE